MTVEALQPVTPLAPRVGRRGIQLAPISVQRQTPVFHRKVVRASPLLPVGTQPNVLKLDLEPPRRISCESTASFISADSVSDFESGPSTPKGVPELKCPETAFAESEKAPKSAKRRPTGCFPAAALIAPMKSAVARALGFCSSTVKAIATPVEPDAAMMQGAQTLEKMVAVSQALMNTVPLTMMGHTHTFEAAILQVLRSGSLRRDVAVACLRTPLGQALQAIHTETIRTCNQLKTSPDPLQALEDAQALARTMGDRIMAVLEEYWKSIARAAYAVNPVQSLESLLPSEACSAQLNARTFGTTVCTLANGVPALVLFALTAVTKVFTVCADLTSRIRDTTRRRDDLDDVIFTAIIRRARAAKRVIFLLRGTHTNLVHRSAENLVQILKPLAGEPLGVRVPIPGIPY